MVTASSADRYAEQAAAEEALAADSVDLDPRRYLLRRGRWIPIDDGPSVDDYQPRDNT